MIPSDNVTEVFSQVTRVNSPFYLSDILIFSILIDVLHYITTGKHYVINKTTGRTSGGATSVEMHKHGGVQVRAGVHFEGGRSQAERQTRQ